MCLLAQRYIALHSENGEVCTGILNDYGFSLKKHHIVLDLGCGAGRHPYEFRDQGFCAFGFDMNKYVKLRDAADIRFFMFPESGDYSFGDVKRLRQLGDENRRLKQMDDGASACRAADADSWDRRKQAALWVSPNLCAGATGRRAGQP